MSSYEDRIKGLEDVLIDVLKKHTVEEISFPLAVRLAAKLYGVKTETAEEYVRRLARETRRLKANNTRFRL